MGWRAIFNMYVYCHFLFVVAVVFNFSSNFTESVLKHCKLNSGSCVEILSLYNASEVCGQPPLWEDPVSERGLETLSGY